MGWKKKLKSNWHMDDVQPLRRLFLPGAVWVPLSLIVIVITSRSWRGVGIWVGFSVASTLIAVAVCSLMRVWARQSTHRRLGIQLAALDVSSFVMFAGSLSAMLFAAPAQASLTFGFIVGWLAASIPLLLVVRSGPFRAGDRRHCARCDYEQTDFRGATGSGVCPECGNDWHQDGGWVRGTLVTRPGYRTAAWCVGFFMLLSFAGLALIPGSWNRGQDVIRRLLPLGVMRRAMFEREYVADPDDWSSIARRSASGNARREYVAAVGAMRLGGRNVRDRLEGSVGAALAPGVWSDDGVSELLSSFLRLEANEYLGITGGPPSIRFVVNTPLDVRVISRYRAGESIWCFACQPDAPCSTAVLTILAQQSGSLQPRVDLPQPIGPWAVVYDIAGCDPAGVERLAVPVMIVAMPIGSRPGPTGVTAAGAPIAPAGALWSRVVPVRVKVERAEK